MFNLKNLDEHLDSNEKVLLFFRPSRRAYLLQYALIILLILLCLFLLSSSFFLRLSMLLRYASFVIFIVCIVLLVRVEYRIWSRRYALSSDRLLYSRGIFSETFMSASYAFITDIRFRQSFWDKLMNTGTIAVDTAGTDRIEIRYRKVNNPLEVKRMINDLQGQNIKTASPLQKRAQGNSLRKERA
ncbi:MAG: PH domain-containing protein [archaeon]